MSLMTVLARCSERNEPLLDYRSREIASAMGEGHVEFYRIMEAAGQMRTLRDATALESPVAEWKRTGGNGTPLGFILDMEGEDPILRPSHVDLWWERGLRVVESIMHGHWLQFFQKALPKTVPAAPVKAPSIPQTRIMS